MVTFTTHFASYNAGESAAFTEDEAARLADLGVTEGGGGGDGGAADEAPTNVTVPHVTQDGAVLNCTMGEWTGEPTSYAYQWQRAGSDVGDGSSTYTISEPDIRSDRDLYRHRDQRSRARPPRRPPTASWSRHRTTDG